MNENDFEYLKVLASTGNITKAAESLYISQAALSKRLKTLEAELGAELFVRYHQGIHLTTIGERVLSHTTKVARELEDMRSEISNMSLEIYGTLRAGISINYSFYRLPELMQRYCTAYPKVNLQITTGRSKRLYQQMQDGELDVAILRGDFSWDGAQYLLSEEPLYVVRTNALKDKPLNELMYIDANADANEDNIISRWLRENGIATASTLQMDNLPSCMGIVNQGLGWALVPSIALEGFDGCVQRCILESGEPMMRICSLIAQPYAAMLEHTKGFIDILLAMSEEENSHLPDK